MHFNKAALSLIAVGASLCAMSSQAAGFSKDTNYVYMESNIKSANGNSILAYRRARNGQLTQLQGSPFYRGVWNTVHRGECGSTRLGSRHHHQSRLLPLFAVNSGSDTIAVFRIKQDGSLEPVKGSPFVSSGNDPVSLDLVGDTLFVVNKSDDPGRTLASFPHNRRGRASHRDACANSHLLPNDTHPQCVTVVAQ